jgi:nicotinamide-nucleotide amidase
MEIEEALVQAKTGSKIILITGGLGPTNDDITKKTLARYFNCTEMVLHKPTLEFIETRCAKRGIEMNELNRLQAEVPACCTVIPNCNGTAPGMWFEKEGIIYVSMPGVPAEMKTMMPEVLKRLQQKFTLPAIFHKTLLTYGIPESELALKIHEWENSLPEEMSPAYLPNIETGVKLRLSMMNAATDGDLLIEQQFNKLIPVLGDCIYGYEPETLESVVGKLLIRRHASVSTAESCTGGRIAHKITAVPGSSEYFKGGVVAYSNEMKINILGVNPDDIKKFGAVSPEIALQMAEGARKISNSDYAVATTGIAGPTGGTADKPVGLCWFGIATPNETKTFSRHFVMDRLGNIAAASSVALNELRLIMNYQLKIKNYE